MMASIRSRGLVASLAVVAMTLAGCTSEQGGAQEEAGAGGGGGAGGVDTPEITIAMITHEPPGDTFWNMIRRGAETAATKNNVNLNYSSDPQSGNQANLVQNAIDQGVDGIAVTLAYPDAMQSGVQAAVDAGIPVVALNAGLDDWSDMGVSMYFGQDEHIAGAAGGERLNEEGAEHVMCVIQEQGHVALEARCAGVEENFDNETTLLYVQGQDMTSVQSSITAQLQQDPSIDTVMTLGAPIAMTALDSVDQAGSDATVVTFDTNEGLLQAIADGEVPWAIDQQPFVQGYLAIDSLWLNVNYGHTIGGGENVLTGPAFIDESNIDAVIEGAGDAETDAEVDAEAEDDA